MAFINSFDGTRIYYEYERNSKNSKTLVFIHGWAHNHTVWKKVSEHFQRKGFSTLTFDLRGHGKSGKPEEISSYDLKNFAEDVHELIKRNRIENPVIIGHSLGGMITLSFLKIFPGQIRGIVLIDASYRNPLESFDSKRLLLAAENLTKFIFSHKKLQRKHFKEVDFSTFRKHSDFYYWLKGLDELPLKSITACLKEILNFDERETLSKIEIPALILWGEKDLIIPSRQVLDMNNEMKNSRLVVIRKGAHDTIMTNQRKINHEIELFLKEIFSTSRQAS